MFLTDVARAYVSARNSDRPMGRELSAKTLEHYLECCESFGRFLCRPATAVDLAAAPVAAFLRSLLDSGLSPYTVKNRRTGLLVQWRFSFAQGWTPTPCAGVKPIYCPPLAVDGYSFEQMTQLLRYVSRMRGRVRNTGIPKPLYWDSFLRTDWEVGLRIGDMLRVEIDQFDAAGWLWTIETKTQKSGWRRLRLSTTQAIARCIAANPHRAKIWPGFTRKNVCRAFSELARAAGVNGTSKFIRSGGSSECDRKQPGTGWQHLRHGSPDVWQKHYKVDKIVEQDRPMPPELPLAI